MTIFPLCRPFESLNTGERIDFRPLGLLQGGLEQPRRLAPSSASRARGTRSPGGGLGRSGGGAGGKRGFGTPIRDASAAVARIPIRGTVLRGCAVAVSGAASRLRVSVTRHPTVLHHIIFSLHCLYAHLLLAICMTPNATRQARLEAGATQERRLYAVACTRFIGRVSCFQ